jgi:hypothetical protein
VVAVLFALSPFVLFMAATQLDHVGEPARTGGRA